MKKYIKYLLYVLEHKKNVFKTCWKRGLYLHAFTHDLSKFLPDEFIPYARYFYGDYPPNALLKDIGYKDILTKEKVKEDFEKAWESHYKRNEHHPEHWNSNPIPNKHILQMICDLEAMSLKFGDTAQEYYLNNYHKWNLDYDSRLELEMMLDINDSPIHNYGHTLEDFANMCNEELYNDYFSDLKEKYGIDTYKMLRGEK